MERNQWSGTSCCIQTLSCRQVSGNWGTDKEEECRGSGVKAIEDRMSDGRESVDVDLVGMWEEQKICS